MLTYANNRLGTNQLDQLIRNAALRVALSIRLDVAQVANVALFVVGGAVGLVVGVDYYTVSTYHPETSFVLPSSPEEMGNFFPRRQGRLPLLRRWKDSEYEGNAQ